MYFSIKHSVYLLNNTKELIDYSFVHTETLVLLSTLLLVMSSANSIFLLRKKKN
jgi:hypothetical protein